MSAGRMQPSSVPFSRPAEPDIAVGPVPLRVDGAAREIIPVEGTQLSACTALCRMHPPSHGVVGASTYALREMKQQVSEFRGDGRIRTADLLLVSHPRLSAVRTSVSAGRTATKPAQLSAPSAAVTAPRACPDLEASASAQHLRAARQGRRWTASAFGRGAAQKDRPSACSAAGPTTIPGLCGDHPRGPCADASRAGPPPSPCTSRRSAVVAKGQH